MPSTLPANVSVLTSLTFDNEDILKAIKFITLCMTKRFVFEADEIDWSVITTSGSSFRVSVIPHVGYTKDPQRTLDALRRVASSCAVFGSGGECGAKSNAWDSVRDEWDIPKHVNYDTAMVMSAPTAGSCKEPGYYLVSGMMTALVAPQLVFTQKAA